MPKLISDEKIASMSKEGVQAAVPAMVEEIQTSYYNLGGLICRVRDEGLFADWKGVEFQTFGDWCEEILTFHLRKAQYLAFIHSTIHFMAPDEDLMARLVALGWVKVGLILRIAKDLKALKAWVKLAEGLSLRELAGKVRFELHQAKEEAAQDADEKPEKAQAPGIVRKFKLTEDQDAHFNKVMDIIGKRFPTTSDGEKVTMLATTYLSAHVRDDEGGLVVELAYLIERIEQEFGVKLKVIKEGAKLAVPAKKPKPELAAV